MIFIGLVLGCLTWFLFYLHRQADIFKYTKTGFLLLSISIMANTSLAQNYTQSLIPGANDGIGISNLMASWIITDSDWGKSWSITLFKNAYDTSMTVCIVVLFLSVASVVMETRRKRLIK